MTRILTVVSLCAIVFLGVLLGLGSLLSIHFELTGFGRPSESEPRFFYIASLALSLIACFGLPIYLIQKFGVRKPSNRDNVLNINESPR